jgi:hypothetical protein
MVTRSLTFLLVISFGFVLAKAEISFQPRETEYTVESVTFKQLAFSDGSGKDVTYKQPPGWKYSGGGNKLTLYPPGKSRAEATMVRINLGKPGSFDKDELKKLTDDALTSLPAGSSNATLVSQQLNPIKVSGKETFLAVVAYTFNGMKFERSLMVLNRGSEQIRFQLTSEAANFNDLQKAFLASHCTWQNL